MMRIGMQSLTGALLALALSVSVSAQMGDAIVIGAVVTTSGGAAEADQSAQRGAQIAVELINEAGGVLGLPLELRVEEADSDSSSVSDAAQRLIEGGAHFILTPSDFELGSAASAAAQAAGLVGISPGASSPQFGAALGDKQFTIAAWTNYASAAAAIFGREQGWRTAYVIVDPATDANRSQGDYFIDAWEQLGGTVIGSDTVEAGAADFDGQLQRLQTLAAAPDAIFVAASMPDLGALLVALRSAGINAPILGGVSYDTSALYAALGAEWGSDIYFSAHSWMNPETSAAMATFIERYTARFEMPPDSAFSALGYDAVQIIAQAVSAARSIDGGAVAQAMRAAEFVLLSGNLDWGDLDSGHEPVKDVFILQVQDGRPSFVTRILPGYIPDA